MASLPDPGRSHAILIGTSTYRHLEDLPAVRNNLTGFRDVLIDPALGGLPADRCTVLEEPPSARAVYRALQRHATATEDTLLVYFAGHGRTGARNELYLCLPDTDPDELWFTALGYEQLREAVSDSRATKKVVILDCCFSGRALADQAGDEESIIGQVGIEGTYILTATAANAVALAPPGERYTAFTGTLLHLLRAGIPDGPELLTFAALYPSLQFSLTSRGLPRPRQQGSDTIGHLALTRNAAHDRCPSAQPTTSTSPSQTALVAHLRGPSAERPDTLVTGHARARTMAELRGRAGGEAAYRGMRAIRRFMIRPTLPEPLAPLRELMLNLRWSWHSPTQELFAAIDPAGRNQVARDPIALLGRLAPGHLYGLATDREYLGRLQAAIAELHDYLSQPRWYQMEAEGSSGENSAEAGGVPAAIAYFSVEYGIVAALPHYSGGMGILAGDHLKAASDLGVPLIGVGLLYRHGYFSQSLSAEGWQLERYPAGDPNGLPLELLHDDAGSPVKVSIVLAEDRSLVAQVWLARVGRVPLLLLDSYVEENEPALQEVTDRLYGGSSEHRLRQELLLGMGGVRAVRAFCALTGHPAPEVFHSNEGHAGFLGLERVREYASAGLSFEEAIEVCRAGTVFTIHSPVPAGIDRFSRDLVEQHFSGSAADPALPVERVLALGAETYPGGDPEMFNMAVMGIRLAQRVNGVSALHGQVIREMFASLWPGFGADEAPISSITNGVHATTWVAPEILGPTMGELAGGQPQRGDGAEWEQIASTDPARLWEIRRLLRSRLVAQARQRLRASWRQRGASDAELSWIQAVLDENVLTIGFARRIPSYKRLTLMLKDPDRLTGLLLNPRRPIQLVIAGKAHPADEGGKQLIQQMVKFADDPQVRHRIVFLPDYDMELGRALVQGCDVWLNNPLRPLEACGTSGMKSALNGGLNLSVRDGWWDEWYDGENGWDIPSADDVADPGRRDELEAAALYDLLEQVVAPLFYDIGGEGLPVRWLKMVAHSLRVLGPRTQASGMVRQYVEELYLPAARASRALTGGGGDGAASFAPARELAAWKRRVIKAWSGVSIQQIEVELNDGSGPGDQLHARAQVALGELSPAEVVVEFVFGPVGEFDEFTDATASDLVSDAAITQDGIACFEGTMTLGLPGLFGYTVRVMPRHPLLASRAEIGLVTYPDAPIGMIDSDLR